MSRKKEDVGIFIVSLLLVVAIVGLINEVQVPTSDFGTPTGYAVTTTGSSVIISSFFSIAKSTNLTDGISFGTIATLPIVNQNATSNYHNGTDADSTGYFISVSSDSNTAVDFCIKADDTLNTSGGDYIEFGNYSWADNESTNVTSPLESGAAINTTYVTGTTNVAVGSDNYYRFWLDVPAGQAAGTYNNTLSFQGVATGNACT